LTNLIERLRERVASPFERPAVDQALMSEAATALSEAKAENERLTRERDKWFREAEERADACSLLIRERDGLREALKRVDRTLTVPAAEYVPAIGDAFDIITEALK
jgi:hypothetical protein